MKCSTHVRQGIVCDFAVLRMYLVIVIFVGMYCERFCFAQRLIAQKYQFHFATWQELED